MYVCHCRGVTSRTVAACVADGAETIDEIAARCGAGAYCGGCRPVLAELLVEAGLPMPTVRRPFVAA